MLRLDISLPKQPRRSEIHIGSTNLLNVGHLIRRTVEPIPDAVCVISNAKVFGLFGTTVSRALKSEGFRVKRWLMGEGEPFKSVKTLELALNFLAEKGFERNDVVISLGGGVVGDLAGLTASMYLRGVPFVQLPTTLLAQIDSSVGGKTGVNLRVGKNLVGTFYQPTLVIIDTQTLSSLPPRELVAGFCEMVKQGLISNPKLFNRTISFLESAYRRRNKFASARFQSLIKEHCKFKASIVASDERESTARHDSASRRILNFGHTTAHALEAVTNYRRFRHGEAVGYGVLVASEISKNIGLLSSPELEFVRHAVRLCGPLPKADDLDRRKIIRALRYDKKRVGGQLNWVLLKGIGMPQIVNGREVSDQVIREALKAGLSDSERRTSH